VRTRFIGGLIMTHSDDNGLIMPPKIAPIQAVIIPVWGTEEQREQVVSKAQEIETILKKEGTATKLDARDGRPGPKFFEWEKKGVPLRIEIGPRDIANGSVVIVRRDTGEKEIVSESELVSFVQKTLDAIQNNLYERALAFREKNTHTVDSWDEFKEVLENQGGFLLAHWCGDEACEAKIKEETKATTRCVPFDQKKEEGKCIYCGKKSSGRIIFAKAY